MPLNFSKPDPRLLRELHAVADHAGELGRVLEKAANIAFPDKFPFQEIELICKMLIGLPEGTAEGSKEILDYGRVRLADIGQRFIKHDDAEAPIGDETPPGLARGMAVDRAIGDLVLAISYAQAEYSRQSGEAIDDDSGTELGVRPGGNLADDLAALRDDLQSIEGEAEQLGRKVDETTLPTSERADELGRQVRDVGSHAGVAWNELEQAAPKPARLERINSVLARLPDVIERTGRAMQVGIDIVEPFADQWFNQLPTDIFNLVLKHLRLVSENIDKAGQCLKKELKLATGPNERPPFTMFRDIEEPWCPEMIQLPAGKFLMGSPETKEDRFYIEGPQHEVTISHPFALGRYPVTFDEFDHFCTEVGIEQPDDQGWGRGRRPVINVSHGDAEAYCAWLSQVTCMRYQLPSEAMWEYACRADTETAYAFGDQLAKTQANFVDSGRRKTSEVGAYPANAWGLHDMHGNVWEWCLDWFHESYEGALDDGSAALLPPGARRVVRGGSWYGHARLARSAYRPGLEPGLRLNDLGFRCAGL